MEINKTTTVCFSGHRELPQGQALIDLRKKLAQEIDQAVADGFDTFLFGAAIGWDLLCGSEALFRRFIVKEGDPPIKVVAIVPFENQAIRWPVSAQEDYHRVLSGCDDVVTLSAQFHPKVYADRNQYMVNHSAKLLCYWNGSSKSGTGQTVNMAKQAGLAVVNLYENATR